MLRTFTKDIENKMKKKILIVWLGVKKIFTVKAGNWNDTK